MVVVLLGGGLGVMRPGVGARWVRTVVEIVGG